MATVVVTPTRMNHVNATLKLYADATTNAAKGFVQSLWALAVLFAGVVALAIVEPLLFDPLGPNTFIASIGRAMLQDAFIATWLSLLGVWVLIRRQVLFRHIKVHAGTLFWPVLTVLFFFWIARYLLNYLPAQHIWLASTAIALVVNPVPEVLYQRREEGLQALQTSAEFMWNHLPEWLAAQLPWLAILALWQWVFLRQTPGIRLAELWQSTGPTLHPLHDPAAYLSYAITGNGLWQTFGYLLLIAGFHYWFLFRGHLFHSLGKGNRRLRAWQARM